MSSFRTGIMKIAPPWLLGPIGERVLYALALPMDAVTEWLFQGIQARFPLVGTPEALGLIGRDRRIVRGFAESNESYALRLIRWLDDWAAGGNAQTLMRQVQAYLSPHAVRMRCVDDAGNWSTLSAEGVFSYTRADNWNWDGETVPGRYWVIIYPPSGLWTEGPSWADADLWGGAWNGGVATWGSTATAAQVRAIRSIVRQWTPEHASCQNIIIAFDPASFDPSSPAGLPDGTWGQWSTDVAGVRVASRLATARYWDGV